MTLRYAFLVSASAFTLLAQIPYGRITGRVVDSGGAVAPGANIRATNIETNVVTNVISDSQGNYELRNLIPGRYSMTAELKGFKRYQRGPIELRVGDVSTVDISLELGPVSESVTVTAEAPLLESAGASVGQVIDNRRLEDLPMPSSSAMYLTQLAPGIVQNTPPSGNWQINQSGSVSNFSTDGTGLRTSEFTMNGVPNMSASGNISFQPMPEVLQEFRVQTAPFDASVGRFTGAQVNMVTKSGTNALHGSLTYQHNNRPLSARSFFQVGDVLPTRMNRYRGYLSGPVYIPKLYNGRNRTFFTFGVDLFARVFVANVVSRNVPIPAERNGDFSALLALGSRYQIYDPRTITAAAGGRTSRLPLAGNVVPANRIDPVARRLLDYYPLPNTTGTADGLANFSGSLVNQPNHHNYIGRVDHVINDNHRLFVGYQHTRENTVQQNQAFPSDFLGTKNQEPGFAVTVDDVMTLRPDLVLNLRYGVNRYRADVLAGSLGFDLTAMGYPASLISQLDPSLTALPQLAIDTFAALGRNSGTKTGNTLHYFAGSVAHSRANHSLSFGAESRLYLQNATNYGFISPAYAFSSDWTRGPLDNSAPAPVGQGLASFLLGLPTGGSIDRNASLAQASKYLAVFAQDDWKVTRKLTVNLGLRYELELPTTERFNRANRGFDFTTVNPIQAKVSGIQTIGGLLFAGVNGVPHGMWETVAHDFGPRVGLAYHLQAKTVLRAGYGIFFDTLGADRIAALQQGFSQSTALRPSPDNGLTFTGTLTNPFPGGIVTPPGASAGLETYLGNAVSLLWPDRRPGYMQRWAFNVQHELPHRVLVEVGYVGNRGTGLAMDQALDAVPAQYLSRSQVRDTATNNSLTGAVPNPFSGLPEFAGSALSTSTVQRQQLLRPYPQFNGVSTTVSGGCSWYHAMQARVEKRLSHGFTVQGSYTWSKAMDATQKLNPTDPYPTHSISTLDRPQHLVVSGIFELPIGKGHRILSGAHGWVNQTLGGWSMQAIFQGQSGPPIAFASDIIFNGNLHDIVLPRSERTVARWFNTDAGFQRDPQQQLVSHLRTFPLMLTGLRADGFNDWDLSLFKAFRITEKVAFQLRGEAQDVLNHAMFAAPNTNPASTLFGQVTTAVSGQGRVITVGARLMW